MLSTLMSLSCTGLLNISHWSGGERQTPMKVWMFLLKLAQVIACRSHTKRPLTTSAALSMLTTPTENHYGALAKTFRHTSYMGAFLSTDLREDVRKSISSGRSKLTEVHDTVLESGELCNIGITDKHGLNRYKDVVDGKGQIVPLIKIQEQSQKEMCHAIKEQQRRKEALAAFIMSKLEDYNDTIEWLTDGRYCAFQQASPGSTKYQIRRTSKEGGLYSQATCQNDDGIFVEYFPAGTTNSPVSADQESYYEIDVPENREWKELIDRFMASFSAGWRQLRRSLKQLTVPQFLKGYVLDREESKVKKVLAEVDGEMQYFLTQVIEHKKRPRSKSDVYEAKLKKNINIAKMVEQEEAAERIARHEYKRMRSVARAIHDAPGAGPELIYSSNHSET